MILPTFVLLTFLLCSLLIVAAHEADIAASVEAPDGTVCFNKCSGHGDCVDYTCHCHVGYEGDDCSVSFVDDIGGGNLPIIPILSAGHFNVTKKNIINTISKHSFIVIGFSSYACSKCILTEPTYANVSTILKDMKIPFARANVDKMKNIAVEFGAMSLPSLVMIKNQRPYLYHGLQTTDAILQFVNKLSAKSPVQKLTSVQAVEEFFSSRTQPQYSMTTIMTIGFFEEYEDIQEDEYNEYIEIAKDLQHNEDLYFAVVTSKKVCQEFKQRKKIDRTPSIVMINQEDKEFAINVDEFYGEGYGLKEWILKNSIPLVGKITPANFALYDKNLKPMLLMFLDLTEEMQSSSPGRVIGGRSGGIFNEVLIEELKLVAKEYSDKVLFGYLDGTLYEDQMKSLGLYGGKERLPSLAFNTRDGKQITFPEDWPINQDTLTQFIADFISGKLKDQNDVKEMAKKALQRAQPISQKNRVTRKEEKKAPEAVQGISEQFGDGRPGDRAVTVVTAKNFNEIVMNEDQDVVLIFHAQACEPCAHFSVYYKRMAQRFYDMNIPSLVIARMDITKEAPPAEYNFIVGPLPLMVIVPATAKHAPWTFYSGVGKMQTMMRWVQKHASIPFDLPNLPHLTEKDRGAYKTQVREREEYLEKKRRDEKKAMDDEDRARKEVLRKQRKAQKQQDKKVQEQDLDYTEDHDEF